MALKKNARYAFGLNYLRIRPLNADLSQPSADNLIGGAGPFDFSGASSAAAVPFVVKIDGGDEKKLTADLSSAVAIAAVTGSELVAALNLALTTASVTVTVDTAEFATPVGVPASVGATVTCRVDLSGLLPGLPATVPVTASIRSRFPSRSCTSRPRSSTRSPAWIPPRRPTAALSCGA